MALSGRHQLKFLILMITVGLLTIACSEPKQPTIAFYPAVANGDLEQLKRHLFWQTDVNQAFADGDTALHLAIKKGDPAIVEQLLTHGAKLNATDANGDQPLETALKHSRVRIAEYLIKSGAPFEGESLLASMVEAGVADRDVYRLLAKHGTDFNAPIEDGATTPLLSAIKRGKPPVVKHLINNGANVNQPGADGVRPLALAKQHNAVQIIQLLEMNGAE